MSLYDSYVNTEHSGINKASGYYNMGVCCIKLSCFSDGIKFFNEALKLRQTCKYFYNAGYCYFKLKDYKKSHVYFKTACAIDSDDLECHRALKAVEKRLHIK